MCDNCSQYESLQDHLRRILELEQQLKNVRDDLHEHQLQDDHENEPF